MQHTNPTNLNNTIFAVMTILIDVPFSAVLLHHIHTSDGYLLFISFLLVVFVSRICVSRFAYMVWFYRNVDNLVSDEKANRIIVVVVASPNI